MRLQPTGVAIVFAGWVFCTGCAPEAQEPAVPAEPVVQAEPMAQAAASDFAGETIHIGVVVSDLAASMRFYEEVIGMQRVTSFALDEDFGRRSGLTGGVPVEIQVLQLGAGETATQWKLMTFGDRAEAQRGDFIHQSTGMQYITLLVTDLNAVVDRLQAHNVTLLGETPTPLPDGRHFVLIQDPDGTFIELIGPMEG
jgi:catechol 2,3-dioxygenase-like lactoylglutathione lyase family enzyme